MPGPNRLLRVARERTPSPRCPRAYMSREEVAEAVALWIADHDDKHRDVAFDANHLGKLERGAVRCPGPLYVDALCAVLKATPAELGFDTDTAVTTRPLRTAPDPAEQDTEQVPADPKDQERLTLAPRAGMTGELLRLLSMAGALTTVHTSQRIIATGGRGLLRR